MEFSKVRSGITVLILGICVALACNGGNSGDDSGDGQADASSPQACKGCNPPNRCCEIAGMSYCLATTSDKLNCGMCGNVCSAQTADSCGGSQCKCGLSGECQDGDSCCPGQGCKDLMGDAQNCGMCGKSCDPGQTCSNGMCSCGGTACTATQKCCAGACVDAQTDEANCGDCATLCTGMTPECNGGDCGCAGGGPACPTMPVPPNAVLIPACCASGCTDTCSDEANCGGCGAACPALEMCIFGGCDMTGSPKLECIFAMP